MAGALTLRYDLGSIVLAGAPAGTPPLAQLRWDERIGAWRGLGRDYRLTVRHLMRQGTPFDDVARSFGELQPPAVRLPPPFPHQQEAFEAWQRGKRGMVELPTGAGKTQLALMAIDAVRRATLVLVPTLELVAQWARVLEQHLGLTPGIVGGGSYEVAPLTVCTYASAQRHAAEFGDRFGLVVFDECHHLGGAGYAEIADLLIAPYRLGLSATIERPDGRHRALDALIGALVYRKPIGDLSGDVLAPYHTEVCHVALNEDERARFAAARGLYREFAQAAGVQLGSARDWQRFVFAAGRSPQGREALRAFYAQKHIAFAAEGKFALCAKLLARHRGQRVLIFTNDNRTAYELSWRFLLPLITHQTRVTERKAIMANFHSARWPVLVTSKVLNEGVDVPAAAVAIIFSGNASVREHVQRLGRILRKDGDKQAVLYELLTRETGEEHTSRRRRQHDAYR